MGARLTREQLDVELAALAVRRAEWQVEWDALQARRSREGQEMLAFMGGCFAGLVLFIGFVAWLAM